jgi:lysophospholipase L1-like esterase
VGLVGIVFGVLLCFGVAWGDDTLIVAWGDSLTEGGVCNSVPTNTYPSRLTELYAADSQSATVLNCGIGGESSAHALSRLKATMLCQGVAYERGYCTDPAQQYIWGSCDGHLWDRSGWYTAYNGQKPKFILLWLGANDRLNRLNFSATLYNLQQMVLVSRQNGITPIIATLSPDGRFDSADCTSGYQGAFNTLIRSDVSEKMDVPLSDQCLAVNNGWSWLSCGDTLHHTDTAYKAYVAPTWYNALQEAGKGGSTKSDVAVFAGSLLLLLER